MAMEVFVSVVDGGSQAAAAQRLQLSRPAVSRALAELEAGAGARLLHRTTRRLSLTPAGADTLPRCRQLLALASDLRAAVAMPDDAPRGLLRVTVSSSFAQAQVVRVVADYVERYPHVAVDLVVLDRAVNLVDERIDLALRISQELDPNLVARRLTACRSVVCASPAYLSRHAAPQRLQDLSQHNCLTHAYYGKSLWHFELDGEPASVAVSGNLSANESTSLMQAALYGAGVALLPTYLAGPRLHSGELVRLLPQARPRELSIFAVYATRKHMTVALRTMLDFLAQAFAPEPPWDRPEPGRTA